MPEPFEPYTKSTLDADAIKYRLRVVEKLVEANTTHRGFKILTPGADREYKDGHKVTVMRYDRSDGVVIHISLVQSWIFQTSLDVSRNNPHRYSEIIHCVAAHKGWTRQYSFFEFEMCLVSLDDMTPFDSQK